MAQNKDHSEIPEWRVQIPARPDRIVTAVVVVHAVVPVGLLGMGLHKAKSENNLKVGMLQSANTIAVLFLRVGLTWSLYLSTWYTESFGPVGSEDSNNFTPISRVCKKKKWGWVAIRCFRFFEIFLLNYYMYGFLVFCPFQIWFVILQLCCTVYGVFSSITVQLSCVGFQSKCSSFF